MVDDGGRRASDLLLDRRPGADCRVKDMGLPVTTSGALSRTFRSIIVYSLYD